MTNGLVFFIGIVFVAVFLLSQGMITPVFGESGKVRKLLKKRLADIEKEMGEESFSSLLREKYLRQLSPIERSLEELPAMESLGGLIEQSGRSVLAHRLVLLAALIATVAGIIAFSMTNQPVVGLLAFAAGGWLPFWKITHDRTKRIQKIEEQLPDAIDMIKRALRAGHPFSGALKLSSEEMADPLASELKATFDDRPYPGGLTYSGHPLACASALASMEIFEDDRVPERALDVGERVIRPELEKFAARHPSIGEVPSPSTGMAALVRRVKVGAVVMGTPLWDAPKSTAARTDRR